MTERRHDWTDELIEVVKLQMGVIEKLQTQRQAVRDALSDPEKERLIGWNHCREAVLTALDGDPDADG